MVGVEEPYSGSSDDARGAGWQPLVVAEVDGTRATWFFGEDRDLALTQDAVSATAVRSDGGYKVTVTADALAKDVALLADKVAPDAEVDTMLLTLLPGETTVFTVRTTADVQPAAFTDPTVLRTANQLR